MSSRKKQGKKAEKRIAHPKLPSITDRPQSVNERQEYGQVCGVFDKLERNTPGFRERFKSITTDNGSEFLVLKDLQRSIRGKRFDVWYCHSYAAWEKGTNENHNRIIRRWFPKGTDFTKITKKRVAEVQNWMKTTHGKY